MSNKSTIWNEQKLNKIRENVLSKLILGCFNSELIINLNFELDLLLF